MKAYSKYRKKHFLLLLILLKIVIHHIDAFIHSCNLILQEVNYFAVERDSYFQIIEFYSAIKINLYE